MKTYEFVGKLTPSEGKVIKRYMDSEIWNLLYVTRSNGNQLIIHYERKSVRKTKKHVPPFKYVSVWINKWGKETTRRSGNDYDYENNFLVDDFTVIRNR